jgi:hypothetical protein
VAAVVIGPNLARIPRNVCHAAMARPQPERRAVLDPEMPRKLRHSRHLSVRCIPLLYWSVTVLGRAQPVAAGRAGELGEARALAELALGVYVADRRELSATRQTGDG